MTGIKLLSFLLYRNNGALRISLELGICINPGLTGYQFPDECFRVQLTSFLLHFLFIKMNFELGVSIRERTGTIRERG